MYSPLSFLKRNLNIPSTLENDNKSINIDTINSFHITEINNKQNENSNNKNNDNKINDEKDISNNTNINNEINKKKENKEENKKKEDNKNKEVIKNKEGIKNKYNFNFYNINIKKKNTKKDEKKTKDKVINIASNYTSTSNLDNKNQVKNILSTLNRIKNTKQNYNDKKPFGFTKIRRKKEKPQIYNINSHLYLKSLPSYSRLSERNINNHFSYYSRSNSKNVLSDRNKNLNLKYFKFSKKRICKSNQKLLSKTFLVENNKMAKRKSNNDLLLSYQKKRNKMYVFKNINNSTSDIKSEYTYNENDIKKNIIDDGLTINSTINSKKVKKGKDSKNNLNKNNTFNTISLSTNLDNSSNNNKILDAYENPTIVNMNKHCDSLVSKMNQKVKEKEKEKENIKNINNSKESIEEDNNNNSKKNYENNENIIVSKKIISNASLSRRGVNRPDEPMKINQDTLFKVKFGDINYSYYGVCDGHGPSGHFVSDFIKSNIAFIVYKHLKALLLQNQQNNIDTNLNEVDDSNIDFSQLFKDCFLLMDAKLNENKTIDIELSGTTCVSLLFCENRIISANVGDSRAIIGKFKLDDNKWDYIPLSSDHIPSDKDEAERIIKSKGIIHPYIDDDGNFAGPDRVWMDDELPGLAMSRSFGDEIASKVGVYAEPEVKVFPFEEEDKFVVIASDGLWEYVTNEEVINIVSDFFDKKDCDGAVSKLYEISHERWIENDDYIDDISIIVVFLE